MSTICIDIGNARLKWRAADSGSVESAMHDGEPATLLRELDALHDRPVRISQNHGTEAEPALRAAAEAAGARDIVFARTEAERDGLRIAYGDPARLGVDRFLAMLALWRERRRGFLVAGAGTALTLDIVDDGGRHLGGYIAPGLHSMRAAVLDRTRFPHAFDAPAVDSPGISTEGCVAEAALAAALGLLERGQRRFGLPGYIGGGDAAILMAHLAPGHWTLREHLVLDALAQEVGPLA